MPQAAPSGNLCLNVADFRAKALAQGAFFVYTIRGVPTFRREAFARSARRDGF
jgi:hypothetical protein